MTRRRHAAFTLVEVVVAAAVSAVLAGIIYTVGSEALTAFARNISINRSYADGRQTLERIANLVQSAGHTPILVDSTGTPTGTSAAAAGIRFYRYAPYPTFIIPSGNSSMTSLTISIQPGQYAPSVGDLVAIGQLAFQGTVTSVGGALAAGAQNIGSLPVTDTLAFAGTINSGCSPVLTTTQNFAFVAGTPTASPPGAANSFSCQVYTQVAFIAVPPVSGTAAGPTPLRYYERAMSAVTGGTACGSLGAFNGATVFNNPASFKVVANLPIGGTTAQISPFQLAGTNPPTLSITLSAEGPDYDNRNLHTANTYTQMQSTLGSRLSNLLLRAPF